MIGRTAYGVAQAVADHVGNHGAAGTIAKALGSAEGLDGDKDEVVGELSRTKSRTTGEIRARTARKWLKKMGFAWDQVKKGVYIDGHERKDVVEYRNNVFLPAFERIRPFLVTWDDKGNLHMPENLPLGQKPLVLVTHDESTFNAYDGKRVMWIDNGKQPLRNKGRGKGLMVSDFLTPGGRLCVPETMSDADIEDKNIPRRYATEYFVFGKDHYWLGANMVDHAVKVAVPIFEATFPDCQAVFLFDNASNHCSFAEDALVVSKMNLNAGGSQARMRDGFIHNKGVPQAMSFSADHPSLAGKPKGIKAVLQERDLWPADGYRLACRKGCQEEGRCCAKAVLASQPDFKAQKGRLQEELEAQGHQVMFYPKFHCDLNWIERYWCQAKWYTRLHCTYKNSDLQTTVTKGLASVNTSTIRGHFQASLRSIEAYSQGLEYGTAAFGNTIYKSHRQVQDKTMW